MKCKIHQDMINLAVKNGMKLPKNKSKGYTQMEWAYKKSCDFLSSFT